MTIKNLLTQGSNRLKTLSDSAQLDAEVILAKILRVPRSLLLTRELDNVSLFKRWQFYYLLGKRLRGWPVAYLVGYKEFYGRKFKVNKHVLLPRPESELLIEQAIGIIRANDTIRTVADVGTGSGCLAIILAIELPHLKIIATDISDAALKVACQNTHLHNVTDRINFKRGDLFDPFKNEKIDLVIANLPYVTQTEYQNNLALKYEPKIALLEQPNLFAKFCQQASQHQETKLIIIETSPLLINKWLKIARTFWPNEQPFVVNDLAGRPRLIIIDSLN